MKTHKSEKTARSIYFYQRVLLIFSFTILTMAPGLARGDCYTMTGTAVQVDSNLKPIITPGCAPGDQNYVDPVDQQTWEDGFASNGVSSNSPIVEQSRLADTCEAKLLAAKTSITPATVSAENAVPPAPLNPACTKAANDAFTKLEACYSKAKTAAMVCLVDKSTIMRSAMPIIGGGLTLIAGMKSMSSACSKQSELMTIAKDALMAYNVACGAAKMMFDTACNNAEASVAEAQNACPASKPSYLAAAPGFGVCKKLSGGYAGNLIAGGAGLIQTIQSALTGNACTQATTTATNVDCTQAANANNLSCVCMNNPNASGCASANGGLGSTAVTGVTSAKDLTLAGAGGLGDPVVASTGNPGGQSLGSGGPTGSGGGSGTPGSGVGGGGSGAALPLAAAKEAGFNNGAGGAGGGGGGYGGGAGGGWADGTSAKGALAGKINSIARNPAAQISGKAGKSNWDKVNNVYLQMSTNLMK